MNRHFPILLLALFCCHAAAHWVLPLANLAQTRARAADKIKGNEGLAEFHFSKKEFEQSRVGRREFRYKGMMHDIASWHILPGDSVRVVARPDPKEEKLLVALHGFFQPETANLPGGGGLLSKLLARVLGEHFLNPEPLAWLSAPVVQSAKNTFIHRQMPLGRLPEVVSPPPEIWLQI